ncbi:hypothetical protein E4U21_006817 [Claviceps maximensis]|nr:hypothetical protein E4U21_006817 [Claviceps maximensis]
MYGLKFIGVAVAMAGAVAAEDQRVDVHVPTAPNDIFKQPRQTNGCTLTLWEFPPFVFGPTRTVYTTTATTTSSVDCGLCKAVVTSDFPDGPGPVVFFSTTITEATPTTVTDFACETSTSHLPRPKQTGGV